MNRRKLSLAVVCVMAWPPVFVQAAEAEVTAPQVVQALEGTFGIHQGERRNHTKGSCAAGEFVGTAEAAKYSRSALFSGRTVPVIARFSLAGGNPKAPDVARSARGMALQFKLPQGQLHQMAMLNTPMFGAASPRTFLDLTQAQRPDPATGKPDPEKLRAFKATHPDNQAQAQYLASHNPPDSYVHSAFFGIHTFKFIGAQDKVTLVRWRFVPQEGEKSLSDEALKTAGADFLERALIDSTAKKPARWDMLVAVGQPGDPQDDPTKPWPAERPEFKAGTLTITSATPQKGAACESINFDPMIMADGIAPTNDPVLRFRSQAYAVSFGKRLSGQ
jgi:catalase